MKPAHLLLALSILLTACAGSGRSDGYISRNTISVKFDQMDVVAGRWDHNNMTILLSSQTNGWTIAHELSHSCDSLGITYATAVAMMGEVPIPRQMEMVRKVAAEAARIGGPDAHWRALYNLCGPQAVYHTEILGRVKALNSLARK